VAGVFAAWAFSAVTAFAGAGAATPPDPLFAYDGSAPFAYQDSLVRTFDKGVTLHDVSFTSPRGGRVHAYLVVPPGRGKFPVVAFGPWGLGNRTEFIPEAVLYAQLGALSIIVDWPWMRPVPDRRERGPLDKPEVDRAVFAQAVVDLRRALDLMVARLDADPTRVAYVGHSCGAQFGAILAALDQRVRAVVLMAGIPDNAVLVESEDADIVAHRSRYTAEQIQTYMKVNAPLDAVNWVGKIPPRPVLMQFAEFERGMTRAAMGRYAAAAKDPKTVLWYPTGHELNDSQALLDRMAFVAKHLRLKSGGLLDFIVRSMRE
jgi:dienelactone hydrolase